MRNSKAIFTIGYEGLNLTQFVKVLQKERIQTLADIRAVPLSRKPGFSKDVLSRSMSSFGIAYRHFRGLGDPKPGRDAAKRGDYAEFERIFRKHLIGHNAQKDLQAVMDIAVKYRVCLLCYEADWSRCHRYIVAEEMRERGGFYTRHLCKIEHHVH